MNLSRKGPILDLQIWVAKAVQLAHGFYRLPLSLERTILAESAISRRVKRDTLFAEGVRCYSARDPQTPVVDRNQAGVTS